EDAAHGLGGGREEMPPAVPVSRGVAPDQAEVRLVDEGGRVKGVVRAFAGHPGGGESAQLGVNERQQVGRGVRLPGRCGVQQARYVRHGRSIPGAKRLRKLPPGGAAFNLLRVFAELQIARRAGDDCERLQPGSEGKPEYWARIGSPVQARSRVDADGPRVQGQWEDSTK